MVLLSNIFEMKKKLWIICICVVLLLVIYILIVLVHKKEKENYVAFENKIFVVELATTDEERQKWLMFRESLDEDKWMLFIFDSEWYYSFWMKNTLIPLDMIWITDVDGESRVVDVQTAQPCEVENCPTFRPAGDALYVLEINAWLAEKYDIKAGDTMYIDITK